MGISVIGGAGAAGEVLPVNALEKVYEAYSADGYFEYSPAGGVPAGKYILQVEGSNVDYVEAVGKGQESKGKGICYLDVEAGGAITATASTFGDASVASSFVRYNAPMFVFDEIQGSPVYDFIPYSPVWTEGDNWVATSGLNSSNQLYTSRNNAVSWRDEKDYSVYSTAIDVMTGTSYNDPQKMGDVIKVGDYLFMSASAASPNSATIFRTSDLNGGAGTWTKLSAATSAWNLGSSPGLPQRLIAYSWGYIRYSDNYGDSWTNASVPNAMNYWSPVIAGSDIYCIESNRFYSSGNSYIIKSSNNGQTWTNVNSIGGTFAPISIANQPGTSNWLVVARDNNSYTYTGTSSDDMANITWQTRTTNTTAPLTQRVIWSEVLGGKWALAQNDGAIYTSTDGLTWTSSFNPNGTYPVIFSEQDGKLIYQAWNSSGIWWTADGVTINQYTSNLGNFQGVSYSNGKYLVTNGQSTALKGPTLDNLTAVSLPVSPGSIVGFGLLLLAKAGTTNNYVYSTDGGDTWASGITNGSYGAPCFVDGKFFRIDTSGGLWSSTDLISWTQRATFGNYTPTRIKKIGSTFIAYGHLSNNGGYRVSNNLSDWTDIYIGQQYGTAWGLVADPASNWTTFHLGNGVPKSSQNWWLGNPYASATYGLSVQINATSTSGAWSNTSEYYDGVEAGGVGWIYTGHIYQDRMYTTNNATTTRLNQTTQHRMVGAWDSTYKCQPAIGFGKVTSVAKNSNFIYQFSYGKPSSIAIYRMKD